MLERRGNAEGEMAGVSRAVLCQCPAPQAAVTMLLMHGEGETTDGAFRHLPLEEWR